MSELPTGTVTFLFTDIEGSTRLLQEMGREDYGTLQERHAAIMRAAIAAGNGVEIRTEGDSFFVVFPTASGAVRAAVEAQRELASDPRPNGQSIRVRMGLHTGEGIVGGDDYLGIDVNRAARIAATGHGGQIVISEATRILVTAALPDGVTVRDLGAHRLKDIEHTEHLHDLVLDELPADFPALRSLQAKRTNLPAPRTSFVGRDREITEIGELLDATRLLTVTGPGGTGKTRLALRIASERLERYADGICFVDLGPVTEPAFVIPEIARALRVRETPGRDLVDALQDDLRGRELLLVLDNFEQLIEASPIVGTLLDDAPRLAVLATSRIPLRLSGEQEFRLSPLPLPLQDELADVERMSTCESVLLFVERAAAVRPGFRVTDENAPAVAQIVARLDGLPLALELAASRLRVLTVEALSARLEQRLPLLTGGARDAPERHRTLEGTIAWSHELLDPDDQRLVAELAVFAGGWTLEAAETVCGDDLDVLGGLGTLVDDSLVRRVELEGGELRFTMLETIREFATDRLETSDADDLVALRRRHAGFFRALAEEAEPFLTRDDQMRWLTILERENDNLRAALDWSQQARADDDVITGLRTATALWHYWKERGRIWEGRPRLERLLGLPGAQRRDAVRARALGALASLAYWQTDYERVGDQYDEAVAIARELGDARLLSWALYDASFVSLVVTQEFVRGEAMLHESLEIAEEGDLYLRAQISTAFAYSRMFGGDTAAATEHFERALALHREAGDSLYIIEDLLGMATVAVTMGDLENARARLDEATQVAVDSANAANVGGLLHPHAWLANQDGGHHHAARLMGAYGRLEEDFDLHIPETGLAYYGDLLQEARATLGEQETERAYAEGFAMNLDQMLELVVADGP